MSAVPTMAAAPIVTAAIAVGLPVFPCRVDKRPACPHGFKDAAISAQAIRELWQRWPGPLIGVPTGVPSGLFVLDVDPEGIDALRTYFDRFWTQALDAFKKMAEQTSVKEER